MEENKIYSIVGKVEIGTDEYRDLIEGKMKAETDASEYRSKFWTEQRKREKLEEEIEELKKKLEKANAFIKQDSERYNGYVLFCSKVN